jgi:hypothetical protein
MNRRILFAVVVASIANPGFAAEGRFDEAARHIIEQTNQFRREQHRPAVTSNDKLMATARDFAAWMASTDMYGHESDGRQPWGRAKAHGYDYCEVAENIAYAWRTTAFTSEELVKEFVEGWEHSPGHRKNMLDPELTETGVAMAQSADTGLYYAVQMFGRPRSLRIEFRIANRSGMAVKYKVGDKTYDLPPRVIMTHELCRPADVALFTADGKTGPAIQPANGERFAVFRTGSGVAFRKE